MSKSCLNCVNCHSWYEPATYWEPGDSGWECKLALDTVESDDAGLGIPLGQYIAKNCPKYEYQEPDTQEPPDEFIESDPELDLLTDSLRLQGMGLLDENLSPTDAFFEWV